MITKEKREQQRQINKEVEEFLKNGGHIQEVSVCETGDPYFTKKRGWNGEIREPESSE